MGAGSVVASIGAGLYSVEFDYGSERVQELIDKLTESLAVKQAELFEAQTELEGKEAQLPELQADVQTAMDAFREAWETNCTPEGYEKDPLRDEIDRLIALSEQLAQLWSDYHELEEQLKDLEEAKTNAEKALDEALDALDESYKTMEGLLKALAYAYWNYILSEQGCLEADDYAACREWYEFKYQYADFEYTYYALEVVPQYESLWDLAYDEWYTADQDFREATDELETLSDQIASLEPEIKEAQEDYQSALVERKDEISKCTILTFAPYFVALSAVQNILLQLQQDIRGLRARVELLEAQINNIEFSIDYYQLLVLDDMIETKSVWCIDYTEGASGGVATIECPGEPPQINIAAGGRSATDADGWLLAREAHTAEQAFVNFAILPGWQRFMPMYRTGVILDIDYDANTASVLLDDARSSAQDLLVNLEEAQVYWDIPVRYMSCNADAFEVGDAVIVQLVNRSWDNPRVIGFVSHPRTCPDNLTVRIGSRKAGKLTWNQPGDAPWTVYGGFTFLDVEYYAALPDGEEAVLWSPQGSGSYDRCPDDGYVRWVESTKVSGHVGYDSFPSYDGKSAWTRATADCRSVFVHGPTPPIEPCDYYELVYTNDTSPIYMSGLIRPDGVRGIPLDWTAPPLQLEHGGWTYNYLTTSVHSGPTSGDDHSPGYFVYEADLSHRG